MPSGRPALAARDDAIWQDYAFGMTQDKIAAKYGLTQGRVSQIIDRIRDSLPVEDNAQRKLRYTAQLDWMSSELHVLAAADPIPAYSNGRPVERDDGTPVWDHSGRMTAMRELRATQERASKMLGLDAAAKVQAEHAFTPSPDLEERIAAARRLLKDGDGAAEPTG
jgi:hypothetical protein